MKYKNPFNLHNLGWLENLSRILAGWFFIYPRPYGILLGILIMIPIIGIIINRLKNRNIASLVKISKNKKGIFERNLAHFIFFPTWAILARAILDYDLDNLTNLWLIGSIFFAIILIVLFLTHRPISKPTQCKWYIYSTILFHIGLYSYATTYAINCTYDYYQPKIYKAEILDKYTSYNYGSRYSGGSYYITIKSWKDTNKEEKFRINEEEYNSIQKGDKINVVLKKGFFNIPWHYVRVKETKKIYLLIGSVPYPTDF